MRHITAKISTGVYFGCEFIFVTVRKISVVLGCLKGSVNLTKDNLATKEVAAKELRVGTSYEFFFHGQQFNQWSYLKQGNLKSN